MIRKPRKSKAGRIPNVMDPTMAMHDAEMEKMLASQYANILSALQRTAIVELSHRYGSVLKIGPCRRFDGYVRVAFEKDFGVLSPEGKVLTLTDMKVLIRRRKSSIKAAMKAYGPSVT